MAATRRFVVVVAALPLLCLGVLKHQKTILSSGTSEVAPNTGRSCTDPSCTSPQQAANDINATEGQTDASNDADALADQVKKNGSATAGSNDFGLPDEEGFLQKHAKQPQTGRSCTDPSCTSPQEAANDINATEGQTDASNDADALADQVKKNGSSTAGSNDFGLPDEEGFLQEHAKQPQTGRSCTDPSCTSPQEAAHDINATEGQTDASNDANALADQVKKNGSSTAGSNDFGLPDEEGFLQKHAKQPQTGRSCTDPSCNSPQEAAHDINATEGQTDASNDADALADQVKKNGSSTAGSNDFGLPDEAGFVQKRRLVIQRRKR